MQKILPSLVKKVAPRTFVNDSCDSYISTVLIEHGWTQVHKNNQTSQLKWTWKADLKDIENQQPLQIINHFSGIQDLTTKIGLAFLFRKNHSINDQGKSYSQFFPRSYNLISEYHDFIQDYLRTAALNLLKKMVACLELYYEDQYKQVKEQAKKMRKEGFDGKLSELLTRKNIFSENEELWNSSIKSFSVNKRIFLPLLFYLQHLLSLDCYFEFSEQELRDMAQYSQKDIPFEGQNMQCPSNSALALLLIYHQKCLKQYPAYFQDGFGNVWIVKSNYSSRGRSIQLIEDLSELKNMSNGMKLIQKYIENVWVLPSLTLIQKRKYPFMEAAIGRKFDIRIWVFVKSFTPLEAYIYDEGYLRLSCQDYNLDKVSDNTCHLTNYATNWKKSKLKEIGSESTFILLSDFFQFLGQEERVDTFLLKKKIDKICLQTLRSADIKESPRSFQLLGFDILLDGQCNPWLIQCNMSPSCSPRGKLIQVSQQMASGMFGILGIIKSPVYSWRKLIKQSTGTKRSSHFIEANKKRTSMGLNTNIGWSKDPLTIRSLKWNSYKNIQKLHFVVEKVRIIQQFYRKRVSNKELPAGQGNCLKMIEVLAKIARRFMTKNIRILQRKLKRKYLNTVTLL